MKDKVLILGSTGMLGHVVYRYFKELNNYDVYDISYRTKLHSKSIILDLKNKDELSKTLNDLRPKYIINCVGILIKGSNFDNSNAIYINSYLPHLLKNHAIKIGSKLIHISTDCVFSGDKGNYTENSFTDGKDIYAKSKSLGEIVDDSNITIRTSIIGPELKCNGEGLFHWFTQQSGAINGYTKAIWSGVTTFELAKAIEWSIRNNINGLYHLTNGKSISKYELLLLFKKELKKEIDIIPVEGKVVNKNFIDTRKLIDYKIPDYDQMIFEMIEAIRNNSNQYKMYNVK